MKIFDGLNVFQLSSYSFNNSGFNNLPIVEIHVFKNTNVKIEVEAVGDQLNVVNKPTKQYLEDNNHFRLHFKSVADFYIYSRDLTTSSISELNFLFDILTKHPKANVKIYIDLSGDSVNGEVRVEAFNVIFEASINQWTAFKD